MKSLIKNTLVVIGFLTFLFVIGAMETYLDEAYPLPTEKSQKEL